MNSRELLASMLIGAAMFDTSYTSQRRKGGTTFCKTKAQTKKRIKAKAAKKARKKNR